tara:strand:- start:8698 stop:8871 length:174 start_codon:yes stop_codon:yes gene_type:complete
LGVINQSISRIPHYQQPGANQYAIEETFDGLMFVFAPSKGNHKADESHEWKEQEFCN